MQGLAIPWQTDFFACSSGWWQAQRPNDVFLDTSNGMNDVHDWDEGASDVINDWARLGYIIDNQGAAIPFVEDERDLSRS